MSVAALILAAALTASPSTDEDMEFVGFSRDESLAAWLVHTEERAPRLKTRVRYSVIRVVATFDSEVMETFRASDVQRVDGGRGRLSVSLASPEYRKARSQRAWIRYSEDHEFSASPFEPDRAVFNVEADVTADLTTEAHSVTVRGNGRAVRYRVSASLTNGTRVSLGRHGFAGNTGDDAVARIFIFRSPSGHHSALLTRYTLTSPNGRSRQRARANINRFWKAPLVGSDWTVAAHSGVQQILFTDPHAQHATGGNIGTGRGQEW